VVRPSDKMSEIFSDIAVKLVEMCVPNALLPDAFLKNGSWPT
jgi:hypothetical protein